MWFGEFKVQTSLYDASQGRNGGGNVNAILKSGTRNFHGDVYEFFRNDVLNANEYFLNRAGQSRPSVKQNIFGGSFGGPVGKDAKGGYFFVNYQGTRQRSGLSPGTFISTTLPVLPSVRDDATLDATLESAFGVPSIDPVIHKLLLFKSNQFGNTAGGFLIPSIPGTVGATGQFIVSKPGSFTDDQFTANWDREFRGGNDKLSAFEKKKRAESLSLPPRNSRSQLAVNWSSVKLPGLLTMNCPVAPTVPGIEGIRNPPAVLPNWLLLNSRSLWITGSMLGTPNADSSVASRVASSRTRRHHRKRRADERARRKAAALPRALIVDEEKSDLGVLATGPPKLPPKMFCLTGALGSGPARFKKYSLAFRTVVAKKFVDIAVKVLVPVSGWH